MGKDKDMSLSIDNIPQVNKLMPERQRQLAISKDTEYFIQNHRNKIEQVKAKLKNVPAQNVPAYNFPVEGIHKRRNMEAVERRHARTSHMNMLKSLNE